MEGGNKQINVLDLIKYTGPSPNFQRKEKEKKPFGACSNKPVRKILNKPIDCPSPLRNKGFNELYRCRPEKQQSSRWEKAVRQPAESKLLLKLQFHDGSFIFRAVEECLCCLPCFPSPWSTKSLTQALLINSSLWTASGQVTVWFTEVSRFLFLSQSVSITIDRAGYCWN